MEQVLHLRENIIKYFRRFDIFLMPALKFFAGFFMFSLIANIGLAIPMFEFLQEPPVGTIFLMTMGAVCAFMSPVIVYLFVALSLAIFLSAVLEAAFVVTVFVILVMFFYVRLSPKESILILGMFFAFYFRIPYIVPIICGLYFGLASIIPVTIGVFAWSFAPVITSLVPANIEAVTMATLDIMELPGTFLEMFSALGEALVTNTGWLLTAFVFALVVVVVHFMSTQDINYSSQISILLGVGICIISFTIVGAVTSDTSSIFSAVLMSIPTVIICLAVNFFDIALDYRKSDRVMFEDDDNVYYVKIVPKIQMFDPEHDSNENNEFVPERQPRTERPVRNERPERIGTPPRMERHERPELSPRPMRTSRTEMQPPNERIPYNTDDRRKKEL
ncbi:MAG: hypothetical protein FWE29_04415 [Defluviitaleaceae bacterium]|nr:hypothetical protein [Defluviitaleaceae bacterium]